MTNSKIMKQIFTTQKKKKKVIELINQLTNTIKIKNYHLLLHTQAMIIKNTEIGKTIEATNLEGLIIPEAADEPGEPEGAVEGDPTSGRTLMATFIPS